MRLVFLGAPGAGKGTQSGRLAIQLGVPHIASGDLFRKIALANPELGERLKAYMDQGNLVPDELTNELVKARLSQPDAADGFILDGYPRNADQARMLDELLASWGIGLDKVLKFSITGPEIVRRLAGRRVCPVDDQVYHVISNPPKVPGICDLDGTPLIQRDDDQEDVVQRRLEVYGQRTKSLYDLYAEKGLLADIDAMGGTEEVYERTLRALNLEPLLTQAGEPAGEPEGGT